MTETRPFFEGRAPVAPELPVNPRETAGDCPICGARNATVFRPTLACGDCIGRALELPDRLLRQRAQRIAHDGTAAELAAILAEHDGLALSWLPVNLRDSAADRLPSPERATTAVAWEPARELPFLLLRGLSGRGKTRILSIILRRRFERTGIAPLVFWAGDLGAEIASAWRNSTAEKFLLHAQDADCLAFDDLDKTKITERVAEFLFAVTDHRMRHGLPMIVTTNLDGESWQKLMPAEYGPALIRRWREHGKAISV